MQKRFYPARNFGKKSFIVLAISLLLLFVGLPVVAKPAHDCKLFQSSQKVKGPCHWVSGELFIYNGWPPNTRLSIRNTNRIYGVGPGETGLMPSYLEDALNKSGPGRVKGQFKICLFGTSYLNPESEINIQNICIQNAKDLYFLNVPDYHPELARWVAFPIPKYFSFVGYPSKQN
ncbi:MAG: hypothetical protein ACRESE_05790 [Gammaproteobacteria bacterium]